MDIKSTIITAKNAIIKAAPYVGLTALGIATGYLYRSKYSVTNKYADQESFDDVSYIICDIFENFLDEHDVTVPCDGDEEPAFDARIYGADRAELQELIANEIWEHRKEFAME